MSHRVESYAMFLQLLDMEESRQLAIDMISVEVLIWTLVVELNEVLNVLEPLE